MIAGEYVHPGPLTPLSLVRYSSFIAWGGNARRFRQLIISLSRPGKAETMALPAIIPSCVPSPRLVGRPVSSSRFISSRLVSCRSRQGRRRFSSIPSPQLVPCHHPLKSSHRCLTPSRPSSRLASRRPSRLYPVSSCPMFRIYRSSCDCAVLSSSSCRSSSCPLSPPLSSSPHDRTMRDGHEYHLTPISRTGN